MRLIQVGMGVWGRDWMAVTANAPGLEPVAWADPSPHARSATIAIGAAPDRVFPDLRAALGAVDADAVLVTTPLDHHVPVVLEALAAGLPVLLEKPFAPTMADAVTAIRAANAASRLLMISQNYRFHPAPRLAAELVAAGRIGDVVGVDVDFRRNGLRRVDWLQRHQAMRHPLLLDMSIHHFDLLRVVLGREADWIQVWPLPGGHTGYGDPPAAAAIIGFPEGILASYRANWVSSGPRTPWGGAWRVEGTRGAIEWTSRGDAGVADRLRLRTPGGAARPQPLPPVPALDREGTVAAFVAAVRSGVEPETSARRNLPTMALTLAAERSVAERRPVALAELLSDVPGDLR